MISKRIYIVFAFLFVFITNVAANVNVTSGGNLNLCVGTAYTTIGNITIAEGGATDFSVSGSVQTYEINAPSNFEFNPSNGSVTASGADITFSAVTVTATKITLIYFVNATATTDNFVLNGIQIRATNPSGSQNIVRTGGTAVQAGNNAYGSVHAQVIANQAYVNLSTSANVVCVSASDINLNGSPNGGSYSVLPSSSGLVGSTFKPALAGAGSYVITYTATDNGCVGTDTVHITVKTAPIVTFFGLVSSYCSADSTKYQLTGFPSGGTFSGNGIVNSSFFYPPNAGVGTNKSVTYQYTANGCQASVVLQTTIKQSPPTTTVTLSLNQTNFFNTDDSILIDGNPSYLSLAGGTLKVSGNGVVTDNSGASRFYPKVIGQGSSIITRTYTATNGCSTTGIKSVTVTNSTGGVIGGISDSVCKTSNKITMTVNNDYGSYYAYYYNTSSGYTLDNNVLTDTDHTNGIALFDPQKATVGTYLIYFFGTLNGLTYKYVQVTSPPIITITNITPSYCSNINEFAIQYGKTGYGNGNVSFSGNGVNNGHFDPSSITSYKIPNLITYNYSDVTGCASTGSISTIIYEAPKGVGFSGLLPVYCSSSAISILIPNSGITPTGGAGSFSGIGLDFNSSLQPIFNPNILLNTSLSSKDYTLTYSYTTTDGCRIDSSKKATVYAVTQPSINGLQTTSRGEYCVGTNPIILTESPAGGTISITAKNQAVLTKNPLQILPVLKFKADSAIPDTYYLKYVYTSPNQCISTIVDTIVINPLPEVYFTGLNNKYCNKDVSSDLIAFPAYIASSGGALPASSFTSTPNPSAVAGPKFLPDQAGVNTHYITYTYTDKNGCKNDSTISTIVYGKPTARFTISSRCEKDIILFRDSLSVVTSSSSASSSINKWKWDIDDKSITKQSLDTALAAGPHKLTYITTTSAGCADTITKNVTIGSYPKTAFTWDKICNTEDTRFYNTSSIIVGTITKAYWEFSDGKDNDSLDYSNNNGNVIHKFDNPGTYKVILTSNTNYNCISTDTQKVFILPAKTIDNLTPYSNDFNDLIGDWVSSSARDTIQSSWTLGAPNKSIIKSNDGAWVTGLKNAFNPNEISYVYSPCFTLTDITKPMIHMDIWSATNKNISGANLQYSVDGTIWNTLGKPNTSGINWYNNGTNISSRPSGTASLDQNGWTGIDSTGWKNVRHIFDSELGTNQNIRFRISFAGGIDTTDGFAFDNVWIGDRTRLILAEHFTNNSNTNTLVENSTLNNLISANLLNNEPKDIVELQYHTAFPGPDQMNARNIPDAGARTLYYGVTQTPYSSVDGSYYNGNTLGITQNMIDTRSLYDPAFNITLNTSLNLNSNNVSGSVTIDNKIPIGNTVTVYISLLERFVNNIPGANGENNYQWVHAKFLPDAAGTSFPANWSAQSSQKINFNWDFTSANIYDPNKLAMIVFVQDNVTQEIYQTAYKGLGASVTTGVFVPTEVSSRISLYPNPANDVTTVILNGKLSGEYNWVITDELGRTVDQGKLKDETEGFTINTINYASGFYTLRLSNAADGVKTQKFVVVH